MRLRSSARIAAWTLTSILGSGRAALATRLAGLSRPPVIVAGGTQLPRAPRVVLLRRELDRKVREEVGPQLQWVVDHLSQADPALMERLADRPLRFVVTPHVNADLAEAGNTRRGSNELLVGFSLWDKNGVEVLLNPAAIHNEASAFMLVHLQLSSLFLPRGQRGRTSLERKISILENSVDALGRLIASLSSGAPPAAGLVEQLREQRSMQDLRLFDLKRNQPHRQPPPDLPSPPTRYPTKVPG